MEKKKRTKKKVHLR